MRAFIPHLFLLLVSLAGNMCLNAGVTSAFSAPPTVIWGQTLRTTTGKETIECRSRYRFDDITRKDAVALHVVSGRNPLPDDKDNSRVERLRRWRLRINKFGKALLLSSALLTSRAKPAEAKFSHEIREERKYSIRPGANQEQASKLMEGEVPDDIPEAKSVFDTGPQSVKDEKASAKAKSAYDYGDGEEDDEDFLDFQDSKDKAPSRKGVGQASQVAERLQTSTRSQFSGIDSSKTKSRAMYVKVSVGLFIPTWGAMGVREFVRRRKEEVYVKKGLKILEAQKAEYFNVTETTPDSDIEDELKDLKDDDDDDDDDDDIR